MNENAVLYALSTLAQTCAALAALVGALGLYRAQSARTEQGQIESTIRHLLISGGHPANVVANWPIAEAVRRANTMASVENQSAEDLRVTLHQLGRFDPAVRRSSRLIVIVGTWDTGAAFLSMIGFTVVPCLMYRWWTPAILSFLAVGTMVTTVAMLFEANGSLVKWLLRFRLAWLVRWLERKPRP